MFSNDRNELRHVFFSAWNKYQKHLPIEPLEAQLIEIILLHPEYQSMLEDPENFQAENFGIENPFLHLSLHLAIREQISTNRPAGVKKYYDALCKKTGDALLAEHQMMDCLAEILWQAQQSGTMPAEAVYLNALQKL